MEVYKITLTEPMQETLVEMLQYAVKAKARYVHAFKNSEYGYDEMALEIEENELLLFTKFEEMIRTKLKNCPF